MDKIDSQQLNSTLRETNQALKAINNTLHELLIVIAKQQSTTLIEETNTTGNLFNM